MVYAATLILLLVTLLSCTCMPGLSDEVEQLWSLTHQRDGGDLTPWLLSDHERGNEPFGAVITKFAVAPLLAAVFVRAWKEIEGPTRNETGNHVFELKKFALDNVVFYEYAEYATRSAYIEHMSSSYMKNFIKSMAAYGIYTELIPTININSGKGPKTNAAVLRDANFRNKPFFVLIDYAVPPTETMEFIQNFRELQVKVVEETALILFSLHKTLTDNIRYKVYGAWESLQDYWNHINSEAAREHAKFNAEGGIVTLANPLSEIGDQREA